MRADLASTRLADEVHLRVREAIVSGELSAGTKLSVPALAEDFNVSRSPVREAIQQLVREGLAVEQVHRGAVVAEITLSHLVELYEIREVLEGLAARLAAERMTPAVLQQLEEAVAAHEAAVRDGSPHGHMDADARFHRLTHEAANNPELLAQMRRLQAMVRMAMHTTSVTAGQEIALKEHQELLRALTAGDPEESERVARSHVARLRAALQAKVDEGDA